MDEPEYSSRAEPEDVRQDVELNQDEGSGISLPLTDRRGLVTLIGKSLDEPRGHMDMGKTQTVKTGSTSNPLGRPITSLQVCPNCGRAGVSIQAKLVCPRCHVLIENCCGD